MDFLTNFRSFFTDEEQKSELYRILASLGVNTEKAILEELNAEIRRSTEISVFNENKIRSWLAFFLSPVRNVVSASGFGHVVMNSADGSSDSFASIPKGVLITGTNGKEYQIQHDILLSLGASTPFSFVQGEESMSQGVYNDFIAIPVPSGMVDLSYTRVIMGDLTIPLVHSFPESPADFAVSISPSSGFFPFFFNNTLFIKIFSGGFPSDSNYVPDPKGKFITVFYRVSDGEAGNIKQNQFKGLSNYTIKTGDSCDVSVTFYNDAAMNGVNSPTRAELVNLLRRRFYAFTSVSSLPEYTTWFLSQPLVGDCLVMSDHERWRLSNYANTQDFNITGSLDVYLVDKNGIPIHPKESVSSDYNTYVQDLENELIKVRDLAFVRYESPVVYWHFFVVQFISTFSDVEFKDNAVSAIRNLYSLSWARDNNLSLFRALDTKFILDALTGSSNVSGLRIIPYHYREVYHSSGVNSSLYLSCFKGEKAGGWYEFYEESSDPLHKFGSVPYSIYREFVGVDGYCFIYEYNVDTFLNADGSMGWSWSSIKTTSEGEPKSVGSRFNEVVSFDMATLPTGVLRCFWLVKNEGSVSVGNSVNSGFGIRKLPDVASLAIKDEELSSKKSPNWGFSSGTFFGEFIRFEKSASF